ncbi:MAG: GDYXXLXY domain-containing protein [Hyphomicrobiaceae bacterium]
MAQAPEAISRPSLGNGLAGQLARWRSWRGGWRLALLAVVALGQALVLGYMVYDRETLLRTAREIALPVVPVDPRSLFRGDYVILGYDIASVPSSFFSGEVHNGSAVRVAIAEREGKWQPVAAAVGNHPLSVAADAVVLAGRIDDVALRRGGEPASLVRVRYGIESFFVPEGTGRPIELEVASRKVVAHIAVRADGTAAIKGLSVDGERIEAPPLF